MNCGLSKNIAFVLSITVFGIMCITVSAAQAVDFIDWTVWPRLLSSTSSISVTVDAGIPNADKMTLPAEGFQATWNIIAKNVNTGAEVNFGPYAKTIQPPFELRPFTEADGSQITYLYFEDIQTLADGSLPNGRYDLRFTMDLTSQKNDPLVTGSAKIDGPRIAVLHGMSDQDRINQAKAAKDAFLSSENCVSSICAAVKEPDVTFVVKGVIPDQLGFTHVVLNQYYKGIKVYDREARLQIDDFTGEIVWMSDEFAKDLNLDTTAAASVDDAISAARAGADNVDSKTSGKPELVIFVDQQDHPHLAYAVSLVAATEGFPFAEKIVVDAKTGVMLDSISTIRSAAASGTGYSLYNGQSPIQTNTVAGGFRMMDMTRAVTPRNRVYGVNFSTDNNIYFATVNNAWGDGLPYTTGDPFSQNGQTSAVDVAYGLQMTYDYFNVKLGHRGWDDGNSPVQIVVHNTEIQRPAVGGGGKIWIRNNPSPASTVDIVGHEFAHSVAEALGVLQGSGFENQALNEASSDIFGTLSEYYTDDVDNTAGSEEGDWKMCDRTPSLSCAHLRLDKPSIDGSYDCWAPNMGNDIYRAGGPLRRLFYFLVVGVQTGESTCGFPGSNPPLSSNFRTSRNMAADIWYNALSHMSGTTNYATARTLTINAAQSLGYNVTTVSNAWAAVGVH